MTLAPEPSAAAVILRRRRAFEFMKTEPKPRAWPHIHMAFTDSPRGEWYWHPVYVKWIRKSAAQNGGELPALR